VLAGLMLASRVGAAMAAELGTMKVTEQLDALYTLATNPLRHLALPRMLACLTMLPLLVVLGNLMGIYGGYLVGVQSLGIPHNLYLEGTFDALKSEDLIMSFTKAAVFGLLVGIWGTYHGFSATGGARGVGVATTRAVVYASASILTADYFVTALFV
jgi:phospholipid/cholesterol/gamma-HCH transport system permease protein